jgi:hypothetical protein
LIIALFTKEEAILVPFVLAAWLVCLRASGKAGADRMARRSLITWAAVSVAAMAVYLVERSQTHAMMPSSAPAFYRPTLNVLMLFRNVGHYADWTLTFSVGVTLLGVAFLGLPRPLIDSRTRTITLCGLFWLVGGLGLTVLVPSRSVLYAVLPSFGGCLAAAALLERVWVHSTPTRQLRAWRVALLLTVLLAPVHYLRSVTMTSIADLSADTLASVPALTAKLPDNGVVVLSEKPRNTRVNLESAFGTLLNDAYRLATGRSLVLWIMPPVHDAAAAGLKAPCDSCVAMTLVRRDARWESETGR